MVFSVSCFRSPAIRAVSLVLLGAAFTSFALTPVAMTLAPVFAQQGKSNTAATSKEKRGKQKYKATINNNQEKTGGAISPLENEEVFLRADITSGVAGLKCDVAPYVTDKCKLKGEALGRLFSAPLVEGRVALWKTWYSRVFEELFPLGYKIPKDVRAKINVTVRKNHKITASYEWMDKTDNEASLKYSREFLARVRSFESAEWIAFPEKSYLDMVTFDVYLKGFDNEGQLANGRQRLDCD
jgi:hypothetical protein